MNKLIIGITGKIGSGKDTVGNIIKELHDNEFFFQNLLQPIKIAKFAKPIKDISIMITGVLDQESQGSKNTYLEDFGMTIREIQQKIGTDCMRDNLHENVWVNALFNTYKSFNVIITDVRFQNEAKAIEDKGGVVVRVLRKDNPYPQSDHTSETALDDEDFYIINNSGTLEDLKKEVVTFINIHELW